MGRLTKRYGDEIGCQRYSCYECCVACNTLDKMLEKLAHYEDLEEAGRLIEVIRCKDCAMESTCVHTQYQGEDGYCSMAELKELER